MRPGDPAAKPRILTNTLAEPPDAPALVAGVKPHAIVRATRSGSSDIGRWPSPIDAAVAQVRQLGGHADDPSPEEPGFGRFSTCTDDQGIPFGLHQSSDS